MIRIARLRNRLALHLAAIAALSMIGIAFPAGSAGASIAGGLLFLSNRTNNSCAVEESLWLVNDTPGLCWTTLGVVTGTVKANGPFTDESFDDQYINHPIFQLQDESDYSNCASDNGGSIKVQPCSDSGNEWVATDYSCQNGTFSGVLVSVTGSDLAKKVTVLGVTGQNPGFALETLLLSSNPWRTWNVQTNYCN